MLTMPRDARQFGAQSNRVKDGKTSSASLLGYPEIVRSHLESQPTLVAPGGEVPVFCGWAPSSSLDD